LLGDVVVEVSAEKYVSIADWCSASCLALPPLDEVSVLVAMHQAQDRAVKVDGQ
jgi:hypothetical protein